MFSGIIIVSLIGVIGIQEYLHYRLVKDLTLKIKAKDLGEYKRAVEKPKKKKPEPVIVPPEEADAEEYLKALKK